LLRSTAEPAPAGLGRRPRVLSAVGGSYLTSGGEHHIHEQLFISQSALTKQIKQLESPSPVQLSPPCARCQRRRASPGWARRAHAWPLSMSAVVSWYRSPARPNTAIVA
jgi:hypothetical protein